MTKLQLLHRAVNERLQAALEQIMEMVGGTVLEYEEETVRVRTENELLRRRLRWMEGENPTDWPDPTEHTVLSVLEQTDFSQTEKQDAPKNLQDVNALIIKTESIDASDFEAFGRNANLTTAVSNDLESITPSTSTPADTGPLGGVVWDTMHNYMAPIDFDPTLPIGRSRNQRRSFACPDCGKVFGREQTLLFHMRVHSTERPYAYRRRKTCFYGDKKQRKKMRGLSKLSKELVEDLSDASEQTECSTGSANISVPITAELSAPETETGEPADEGSKHDNGSNKCAEESSAKPVALKTKQRPEKTRIHRCQQCNRAYTLLSRLALHLKTHKPPFSNPELKEQNETEKPDKKSQQLHKEAFERKRETSSSIGQPFGMPSGPQVSEMWSKLKSRDELRRTKHCFYCKRPSQRMTHHLQTVHRKEPAVARALSYGKSSKERKWLLDLLQNKGNLLYDTALMSQLGTSLALQRQDKHGCNKGQVQCKYCHQLFSSKCVANHVQRCRHKYPDMTSSASFMTNISSQNTFSQECNDTSLKPANSNILLHLDCYSKEHLNTDIKAAPSFPNVAGSLMGKQKISDPCTSLEHGQILPLCNIPGSSSNKTGKNMITAEGNSLQGHTIVNKKKSTSKKDTSDKEKSESPGQKVHICQHCCATFCSPFHLRRHVYTHTGERPFWCSQCNIGFIQKYRLRNHMMAYHREAQSNMIQRPKGTQKKHCSKASEDRSPPADKEHLKELHT